MNPNRSSLSVRVQLRDSKQLESFSLTTWFPLPVHKKGEQNMADEIEDEEIVEDVPTEEEQPEKVEEPQGLSEEEQAKQKLEQDLVNLGKAKAEALAELSRIRTEKKTLKKGEEEELPKIDLDDPSAKAWDKRIQESVQPVHKELEQARAEVRDYALQKFLQEKPALAKDPEKVKELMSVYDRLHTASERTVEGVLMDLNRSYGAITYEQQQIADQQVRIAQAQSDAQFSEAAISRGATGYQSNKPGKKRVYTEEERDLIKQWERFGAPKVE